MFNKIYYFFCEKISFLFNYFTFFSSLKNLYCKKVNNTSKFLTNEEFLNYCRTGKYDTLANFDFKSYNLNKGLNEVVKRNDTNMAEILIKNGATEVNKNLELACLNGNYNMAELLVKNGANPKKGLKTATSINIIKMLFRYAQNEHLINY